MSEAEKERAAIVKWLQDEGASLPITLVGHLMRATLYGLASAIKSGAHHKREQ